MSGSGASDVAIAWIRELLKQGHGPDQIVREVTGRIYDNALHTRVIIEKTKLDGTYKTVPATPAAVAEARDGRQPMPRWKELAAMVYGEANAASVDSVRKLYEQKRGPGSSSRSWTGRGRKPSGYAEPER